MSYYYRRAVGHSHAALLFPLATAAALPCKGVAGLGACGALHTRRGLRLEQQSRSSRRACVCTDASGTYLSEHEFAGHAVSCAAAVCVQLWLAHMRPT